MKSKPMLINVIHNDDKWLICVDLDHLDPAHYLLYTQNKIIYFGPTYYYLWINLRPFQNPFTLLPQYTTQTKM